MLEDSLLYLSLYKHMRVLPEKYYVTKCTAAISVAILLHVSSFKIQPRRMFDPT